MTKREALLKEIRQTAMWWRRAKKNAATDLQNCLRKGRWAGLSLREMGKAAGLHWTRVQQLTREEGSK